MGLTAEGRVAALATGGACLAALASGNNLVVLVAAAGLVCWAIEAVIGAANLRGLAVRRGLPDELFAETEAHGWLFVQNQRRWLTSGEVVVVDGGGGAVVEAVPPGVERRAPARWRFPRRGVARLAGIELRSAFPFGWRERRRALSDAVELLVYPCPRGAGQRAELGDLPGEASSGGRDGAGELADLRPWRDGDPLRRVHAATSARFDAWWVAERDAERTPAVWIELEDDRPLEEALARATAEVLRAFEAGAAVGLRLGAAGWPPAVGAAWRRTLLEALSRY